MNQTQAMFYLACIYLTQNEKHKLIFMDRIFICNKLVSYGKREACHIHQVIVGLKCCRNIILPKRCLISLHILWNNLGFLFCVISLCLRSEHSIRKILYLKASITEHVHDLCCRCIFFTNLSHLYLTVAVVVMVNQGVQVGMARMDRAS